MANLTGLFRRGGSYYIRIVLPDGHPLHEKYRSGRFIQTLGASNAQVSYREGDLVRRFHAEGLTVAGRNGPELT
jgi:hypothetical protein